MTIQVKYLDEYNRRKLKRCKKYLKRKRGMKLTFQDKIINFIKCYVDAYFATQHNCSGHTGATMKLGTGAVSSVSIDQKLNIKGSNKIQLICLKYDFPSMLWMRLLIMGKCYFMTGNIGYQ